MLTNCNVPSDLAVPLFVTRMFHIWPLNESSLSLVSDVLVGLACVYLWITGWASKYSTICCCHQLAEISEKWQFSAEIKKRYRLHWQKVQLPEWSMDVIWRLGTELRHFDQEIWGGNNCDMVVFTVDERRVEVVFFPSLSVSIVHFTVNSLWQSFHLLLRCMLSRIWSNLNFEKSIF